jgi:hypothetical protein
LYPARFPFGGDTIYVCAPARYDALTAPVLFAFLEPLRAATYQAAAAVTLRLPVTLVLDEVANIAPLPDLPAMVSERGGSRPLSAISWSSSRPFRSVPCAAGGERER